MTDIHEYLGYAISGAFGALFLWAAVTYARRRVPGEGFWRLLGVLQVAIGIQLVVGGILYLTGARPEPRGPEFLHYVYGAAFPAIVLFVAHRFARKYAELSWMIFGVAAFVCCFSTIRALQTGLGID